MTSKPKPGPPDAPRPVATREQLAQRLERLKASNPKVNPEAGAMCYRMAAPPETADYVCPRCAARTQWTRNRTTGRLIEQTLPAMRKKLAVPGLKLSLDETQLCRTCTPKGLADPLVTLVVEYPDGAVHRCQGVGLDDLDLLRELQEGKEVHVGAQGDETPLKQHLPRIEKLLGVKVK